MTIATCVLCDANGCDAVYAPDDATGRPRISVEAHHAGWASAYQAGRWQNYCPDHTNTENKETA